MGIFRKVLIWVIASTFIATLIFISFEKPSNMFNAFNETLSAEKMDYDTEKSQHFDTEGNLLVPFDIAYPEAFAAGEVTYDDTTVLIKMRGTYDGSVSINMRNAGVDTLTHVIGDEEAKWYEASLREDFDVYNSVSLLRTLDEILVVDYHYQYQKEVIDSTTYDIFEVDPILDLPEIFYTLGLDGNQQIEGQWHLQSNGIPEAWEWMHNHETYHGSAGGSRDVIVAVIDTGVDYNHPDLKANMWINPNETKNGQDSNGNGYVDDIHGANMINSTGNPMDDHGHGTHVAGIIAGANNKEGIVGVAYNVQIMAIKSGMSSGFFSASAIARGIEYAYLNGADVINMSFGGSMPSIAVQDALMLAYTRSVLVASAGNNGLPNEPTINYPIPAPNYPAALSYVVGVMSVGPSGMESAFTNWDPYVYNNIEYEVYAPGEAILSTLPNEQYATWNGTSMATPIVAGIAALVRSVYNDRDVYPNKFIMGQVVSASNNPATCFNPQLRGDRDYPLASIVDAKAALTKLPKPDVSLYDYYIYDPVEISEQNNGDGIIDAGETIQIGLVLRNRWGKSADTTITMDTLTPMGEPLQEGQESYITFIEDEVLFGDVGTYSTKDFLTREGSIVKGVEVPFVFTVAEDTPNDYIIRINIRGTYSNALDESDKTEYEIEDTFIYLTVRNGEILPNRIQEDMVLDNSNLYIIPNSMIIEEGATVTVMPGTKIQFWSDDPNDAYADEAITYLRVQGNLIIEGTPEEMVELFPSDLRSNFRVEIFHTENGYVSIKHAKIINPHLRIDYLGHSLLTQNYVSNLYYRELDSGVVHTRNWNPIVLDIAYAEYNKFEVLGGMRNYSWQTAQFQGNYFNNLFRENNANFNGYYENNVFLRNNNTRYQGGQGSSEAILAPSNITIQNVIYDAVNGKTYIELYGERHASRRFAQELGGDLAVFETEAEMDFVLPRLSLWDGYYYNIGLGYSYDNDQLEWVNGEAFTLDDDLPIYPYYSINRNGDIVKGAFDSRYSDRYDRYTLIEIPGKIYANNIYLNDSSVEIDMESLYQMIPSTSPNTVDVETLIYVSDDEGVVQVSKDGLVTPTGLGDATVYIYSEDYVVQNTIQFSVVEKIPLESIQAELNNYQLGINTTQIIDLDFYPSDTTQRYVTYESSDEAVATVSNLGIITANNVGTATITVISQDGTITDSFDITVVSPVTDVRFEESVYVTNLDSIDDITPLITPLDATNQNIIWMSSNPEVAYVDEAGNLIKLKEGVTTLLAIVENTDLKAELIVQVSNDYQSSEVLKMIQINNYYFALTSDGNLYYWGDNVLAPKKVNIDTQIVDFAYYQSRMLILNQEGTLEVYNYNSILGENPYISNRDGLETVTNIQSIHSDYSGQKLFMLRHDGSVWAVGRNYYSILGDGSTVSRWSPVQVIIQDVVDIKVTYGSAFFLTSEGQVYLSGSQAEYSTPVLIHENVLSMRHVDKTVSWGRVVINTANQSYHYSSNLTPDSTHTNIPNDTYTYLYDNYRYYIEDGFVYVRGHGNTYGQFGVGHTESVNEYIAMDKIEDAKRIFAFGNNIFIQTHSNAFYGTGRNQQYQLATFDQADRHIPSRIFFGLTGNEGGFQLKSINIENYELYGNQIALDFNEALVIGNNFPFISLTNSANESLAIFRDFHLNELYITPYSDMVVGETYTLTIPSGALNTKFMVSNELLEITFTYMGNYNPSLLADNEAHYISSVEPITTMGVISSDVQVVYSEEGFKVDIAIDTADTDVLYEILTALNVSRIKDIDGQWIDVAEENKQAILELYRVSHMNGINYQVEIVVDAEIHQETYEPFSTKFTMHLNYSTTEHIYDDLMEAYLNMEMLLLDESHMNGTDRYAVDQPITFTFNAATASEMFEAIALYDLNQNMIDTEISLVDGILTITPVTPLAEGTYYRVFIPENALIDELGNQNKDIESIFKTYNPIHLDRTSIEAGSTKVNPNQTLRFFYNYGEIGPNFESILLLDASGTEIAINVSLIDRVLYITPIDALLDNAVYTVILPEGALVDEANIASDAFSLSFTTIPVEERFFWNATNMGEALEQFRLEGKITNRFYNNAILNNFTDTDVNNWLRFQGTQGDGVNQTAGMSGNYWGTIDEAMIQKQIIDFDNFQNLIDIIEGEYLTTPPENTFPFVADVQVLDADGNQQYSYGSEVVQFVVTFSRDMDMSVPLDFRFGSSLPYAEYKIEGEYSDARTWVGVYELRSFVESGNQYFNIQNGHAKDDPWLTLGWDVQRFTFIYDTTEAQALTMQGYADETGIHLTWLQDDYETLAGYNLYRSTSEDGPYTRINETILPYDANSFTDYTVEPGQMYYYKFTVVLTDFDIETGGFKESEASGRISIRALDTIKPNIYHTPIYQTYAERNLVLSAIIVDNVAVAHATVYYRIPGEETYRSTPMTALNDRYTGIISAMHVTTEGLEYYIEASDGLNYQYYGSAENPIVVTVTELINEDARGDVNGDGVVDVLDALLILQHINGFIELDEGQFARADLNGDGTLSSAEALIILQYAIGSRGTLDYD